MRETQGIEFRSKSSVPTQPGWYYVKMYDDPEIIPIRVVRVRNFDTGEHHLGIWIPGHDVVRLENLDDYTEAWFGPVREVREASAQ